MINHVGIPVDLDVSSGAVSLLGLLNYAESLIIIITLQKNSIFYIKLKQK
jgi:hypothetical protein